jgi:anthraniloyl-CoA monooxygenase
MNTGGSLENAVVIHWKYLARCVPSGCLILPMSVRISAHDWAEGITDDDAVEIARLFKEAGQM